MSSLNNENMDKLLGTFFIKVTESKGCETSKGSYFEKRVELGN